MSDYCYSDTETSISLASSPLPPKVFHAKVIPQATIPCPEQHASIARRFLAFLGTIVTGALTITLLVVCVHLGATIWGPVCLTHGATLPAEWKLEEPLEEREIWESEGGEETDEEQELRSAQRRRMTTAIVLARFNTWQSPSPWRVFAHGAQGAILEGPATPPAPIVGPPSPPVAPNDPLYEREMLVLDQHVIEDRDVMQAVERKLALREIREKQRAGHAQAANPPEVSLKATFVEDAVEDGELPNDMSSVGRPVWAYASEPSSPVPYRLSSPVSHRLPSPVFHPLPSPTPIRRHMSPRDPSLELRDVDVYGPVISSTANPSAAIGVRRKRSADAAGLEETASVKKKIKLSSTATKERRANLLKVFSRMDLASHGRRKRKSDCSPYDEPPSVSSIGGTKTPKKLTWLQFRDST